MRMIGQLYLHFSIDVYDRPAPLQCPSQNEHKTQEMQCTPPALATNLLGCCCNVVELLWCLTDRSVGWVGWLQVPRCWNIPHAHRSITAYERGSLHAICPLWASILHKGMSEDWCFWFSNRRGGGFLTNKWMWNRPNSFGGFGEFIAVHVSLPWI